MTTTAKNKRDQQLAHLRDKLSQDRICVGTRQLAFLFAEFDAAESREKTLGTAIATLCSERGLKRCDDDDCASCPLFAILNEEAPAS